jgi:2'-hydroxyisoflavone reductase
LIAEAKSLRPVQQTIPFSSSMLAIWRNGQFGWSRIAETGIYNATGPAKPLAIGEMLDQIKGALNWDAKFTWVPGDFLEKEKVEAWSDMPVWTGEESGMARTNITRALAKGLTFRPLADTARDTLAWFKSQPQDRQSKLRAGLTPEREAEVLAAWRKQLG